MRIMKDKARLATYGALTLLWVLSCLPFFVLRYEFSGTVLQNCNDEASYYALLYSPFFLFPIAFGWLLTLFLAHPFWNTLRYLILLPSPLRRRRFSIIGGFLILAITVICISEFGSSTPAIWSFPPNVLAENSHGQKARELLSERCSREPSELDHSEKTEFANSLSILKDSPGILSWSELAYRVGFVAMTTQFSLLIITILVSSGNAQFQKRTILLLAPALIIATLWIPMRITFLFEKLTIYPGDPLLYANYLIFLVFWSSWTYLIFGLRHNERAMLIYNLVTGGLGLLVDILALAGIPRGLSPVTETLVRLFGTDSSNLHYVWMPLFLAIVFFPYILRLLENFSLAENDDSMKK